jgi:hypothetical protein
LPARLGELLQDAGEIAGDGSAGDAARPARGSEASNTGSANTASSLAAGARPAISARRVAIADADGSMTILGAAACVISAGLLQVRRAHLRRTESASCRISGTRAPCWASMGPGVASAGM